MLLVAHLLQRPDDVAIYEDGTFQPSLTVEMVERLVKSPQRFALKSFEQDTSRAQILAAIAKVTASLGVGGLSTTTRSGLRNETVLAVAAPLLNLVRGMNLYTRRTSLLSPQALAVRDLLLKAREPDQLLLVDLPAACGSEGPTWRKPSAAAIDKFARVLRRSLRELQHAYERQLFQVRDWLAESFSESADLGTLRKSLSARAEQIDDKVIDGKLKAFIFNVTDDSTDREGWLGRIGLAITGKSDSGFVPASRGSACRSASPEVRGRVHGSARHLHNAGGRRSHPGAVLRRRCCRLLPGACLRVPEGCREGRRRAPGPRCVRLAAPRRATSFPGAARHHVGSTCTPDHEQEGQWWPVTR